MSEIRAKRIPRESGAKKQEEPPVPPPTETAVSALAVAVQASEASGPEPPVTEAAAEPSAAVPALLPVQQPQTRDGFGAMLEAQKILVRGCEEVLETWAGAVKTGLAASRDAGIAMLTARSVFDAIAANLEFSNRAAGVWAAGSCRLSEIGCKTAAGASRELSRAA